jgi:hypothetical protein
MQYLLHDLIKLPLHERLVIIEKVITSVIPWETETETKSITPPKEMLATNNKN